MIIFVRYIDPRQTKINRHLAVRVGCLSNCLFHDRAREKQKTADDLIDALMTPFDEAGGTLTDAVGLNSGVTRGSVTTADIGGSYNHIAQDGRGMENARRCSRSMLRACAVLWILLWLYSLCSDYVANATHQTPFVSECESGGSEGCTSSRVCALLHSAASAAAGASPRVLVALPVGQKGRHHVEMILHKLASPHFDVFLFEYGTADFLDSPWPIRVVRLAYPTQMKWWYIQRFITPQRVAAYDHVWIIDDDADISHIEPAHLMQVMQHHNISMAQPAQRSPGGWWSINRQQFHAADTQRIGRWTNFVEAGPAIIFQRHFYQTCAWPFLQEDLTSGYGFDSMLAQHCHHTLGFERFAVIDRLPLLHLDLKTASDTKAKNRPRFDPVTELAAYQTRYPHLAINHERDGYRSYGYVVDAAP